MKKENRKIDWSDQCWKEMLIYQRKSIWLEDSLEKKSLLLVVVILRNTSALERFWIKYILR